MRVGSVSDWSSSGTSDHWAMDRWGVPHNMFGAIGEDFYGLVGRIVLVSALLENRLHVLFCALASAPEEERAGEPGTELAKACRDYLDRMAVERRPEALDVLAGAESALRRRNEVSDSREIRGWRQVPKRRRMDPARAVEWTSMHSEELPELLGDLLDAFRRCLA